MIRFALALVALAAAALAGWQGALYWPPESYNFAGWALFSAIAIGAVGRELADRLREGGR
jgi:hypothetical protein